MPLFLSLYVIGILGSLIHIYCLSPSQRTKPRVIEILLLYQIVFSLGLTSLMAFFGLTFLADYIAQLTGWPACPFEQQLANVNLGYAVLGLLSIAYRGYFWAATVIGFSVWIIADGIHHLHHAIIHQNLTPGNIGVPLWTDFIVPFILLILLYLYFKHRK
ncbi:MAG: hypothetical protein BGO14_04620 [Chlamydiales bacterium 38-26]|nr:hypothetical protein [Chlamydiales bacterium]OJV07776.1 MAG: hypothetical protein BGO14_04620 [Chlamydiales bacterium 38-26]